MNNPETREYLTKHEQFVLAAMQALLSNTKINTDNTEHIANTAIRQADMITTMLEETANQSERATD